MKLILDDSFKGKYPKTEINAPSSKMEQTFTLQVMYIHEKDTNIDTLKKKTIKLKKLLSSIATEIVNTLKVDGKKVDISNENISKMKEFADNPKTHTLYSINFKPLRKKVIKELEKFIKNNKIYISSFRDHRSYSQKRNKVKIYENNIERLIDKTNQDKLKEVFFDRISSGNVTKNIEDSLCAKYPNIEFHSTGGDNNSELTWIVDMMRSLHKEQ